MIDVTCSTQLTGYYNFRDSKDFSTRIDIIKLWNSRKKSVLVMGYEAYETLTNQIKLEKFGEKTKAKVLQALVDPGMC